MREIAKLIPDDEFEKFLIEIKENVMRWEQEGYGYISQKVRMANLITGISDKNMVFTVGQLERLFDLVEDK